ncbi:MAG: outer membrane beta-barrel family protein, partial [Dysgonamonadaceae bacterium]|nr:outer membrane beta-barrel family protein [Dysgonamonadaceae bacterium]
MKYLILTFALILSFTFSIQAQLKGTLIDQDKQPIEFANVALYSLPDSVMIAGTVSDEKGNFSLNGNGTDDAFLKVSFIGYETQLVPAMKEQTIVMKAEASQLGEVVIKGGLPKIRLRNDALVTTVQNSVLSKAGTANDVLKRLPSITGKDGKFSVFGKGQAKIYINNREMSDVSELDILNSADIKEVEIVNNPGASYDASVKAVIRIYTLRKVGDGFSFDVRSSYFQSQNTDLTEQLNVNYRQNGWDVFGTFTYNRNASIQDSKMTQNTYVDTLWIQENDMYSDRLSHTLTGIAGVNYEISPKQYIGMKYTHTAFPSFNSLTELNSTVLADGVFYDKWNSVEKTKTSHKPSHRLNAYYNGSFGDLKLDFNTDFYKGTAISKSFVTETSQEYDNREVKSENRVDNRLIAAKLVLSHPLFGGQLSAGSEFTDTDRKDEYTNNQKIVPSSNTTIKEQNSSFFAEYSHPTPIGQLGAGLRYENVQSDYFDNEAKIDEQSRRYDQWFPNVSLATTLREVNLQLSYTAKTKRPTYRQLSSNVFYGNRFTLQTGNPFLKPATIHDVTLVGTWKFLQLMASYKNEKNTVIYWAEQLEENPAVTLLAYRNLEKLPSLSAFLTASPTFGIWSPQASVGFIKQKLTITTNSIPIVLNKPMPIASLNNSFSLPMNVLFSLDLSFQGKGNYQNVYLSENISVVNIGLTKSFLNDQLQVSL